MWGFTGKLNLQGKVWTKMFEPLEHFVGSLCGVIVGLQNVLQYIQPERIRGNFIGSSMMLFWTELDSPARQCANPQGLWCHSKKWVFLFVTQLLLLKLLSSNKNAKQCTILSSTKICNANRCTQQDMISLNLWQLLKTPKIRKNNIFRRFKRHTVASPVKV